MFYSRKGPSINFLGPGKRRFPGGSFARYPARKVYVYVVFSPLIFCCAGDLWRTFVKFIVKKRLRQKSEGNFSEVPGEFCGGIFWWVFFGPFS